MSRGSLLPSALVVLLAVAGAAPAEARSRPCSPVPRASCLEVKVPLDPSGAAPGEIGLHVVRVRARKDTGKALVYLSGGPGATATTEFSSALADRPIRRLRRRHHLVTFDQRGTGRSGLLRCPTLERDPRLRSTRGGEECADAIGPKRAFFTTRETVADLEAVRVAIGADRLLLYGVSYGTQVALEYSRAYPDRVARMILDSVVDPDDTDAFGMEPYRNVGPSLRGLCPNGCAGVTKDPVADLRALTRRLRERPVRGVTPLDVSDLLFDADYAPELRTGLPAAVRSLLDHDNPRPLRRLFRAARPLLEPGPVRDFASGRYATTCEETPLPWDPGTPMDQRLDEARTRAAALGDDAFVPFDFEVLRADEIDLCLRWPSAPPPAEVERPYPEVPALLLQGGEDLRTPPTTSQRIDGRLPLAERVFVPGVGHAVLASDPSGCARRRLSRWLKGREVEPNCPRVETGVPAVPVIPRDVRSTRPARGLDGTLGRTVAALSVTLEDLGFMLSPAFSLAPTNRGLARGRIRIGSRRLALERFSAVRGVWMRGRIGPDGVLEARVGGRQASRGRIEVAPGGRMEGRLGGRRVVAQLEAGGRTSAAATAAMARR